MTTLEGKPPFRLSPRNLINLAVALVVIVVVYNFFSGLYFYNTAGWYTVKQDIITGHMHVYADPGWNTRFFGYTWQFKFSEIYYFSKHDNEGTANDDSVHVRFNDGGKAALTGNVRLEMPIDDASRILLQQHFRNWENFLEMGVRKVIDEAVILTASLMTSEESYATKRALFSQMVSDQIQHGIYLTEELIESETDPKNGEQTIHRSTVIKRDAKGIPLRKDNPMKSYNVRWNQFIIKEIDYEKDTLAQIEQKRAAVQSITTSIADAEKAAQNKITAAKIGEQAVMEAKYRAEVEKQSAIVKARQEQQVAETQAQQRLNVADLDAQAAEQEMRGSTLKGEAEYQVARKRLDADGALALKGNAILKIQEAWAQALQKAKSPLVPEVSSIPGLNAVALVQTIMDQITAKLCHELGIDLKPTPMNSSAPSAKK